MKKIDFNREWTVQKEGSTAEKIVNLPHDAMLAEERKKEAPSGGSGAYFSGGKYYYRKKLEMKDDLKGKTVYLSCDSVYQNATVKINHKTAAIHPYGYTNFYVNMTDYLDAEGANEIEITADNEKTPNSRWYSGSGIYREVCLLVGGENHIRPDGVRITTLAENRIKVDTSFVGEGQTEVEILDKDKVIASAEGAECELTIPNAVMWSAENPYLYRCRVQLIKQGQVSDETTVSFGMRLISWGEEGFMVNGTNTLLRGACIHHDNGILGACDFRDAEYRRVRILKEAGFNAIRSSHNPISEAMLDACDSLGMYVMDETWDYWLVHKNPYDHADKTFMDWWKKDIDFMIGRDYNHPSVVMYSIGNEISELGTSEGQKLCREIAEYVKTLDSTRAVTCGINLMLASMAAKGGGIYGEKKNGKENKNGSQSLDSIPTSTFYNILMNKMGGVIDKMASRPGADRVCDQISPLLDISGYNYATSRYEKEYNSGKKRCFVGSETLPQSLYKNWKLVKKIPNLIGDFMWTGWDYLGETGLGTIRYIDKKTSENVYPGLPIISGSGVIDICGFQRAETGWNRIIWGLQTEPVIAVDPVIHSGCKRGASMWRVTDGLESWSWEGCEGRKTNVTVYGNGERAELYCNEKKIGSAKIKECKAVFKKVIYTPGKLMAVVYDKQGKETGSRQLLSAAGKTSIQLKGEKSVLNCNGQDLCFIRVELTGENGEVKSSIDRLLEVKVEGAGMLQGFGSAVPNSEYSFLEGKYRTYYGRALLVVRAGYEPGEIKVTVRGEGLEEQTMEIRVAGF